MGSRRLGVGERRDRHEALEPEGREGEDVLGEGLDRGGGNAPFLRLACHVHLDQDCQPAAGPGGFRVERSGQGRGVDRLDAVEGRDGGPDLVALQAADQVPRPGAARRRFPDPFSDAQASARARGNPPRG